MEWLENLMVSHKTKNSTFSTLNLLCALALFAAGVSPVQLIAANLPKAKNAESKPKGETSEGTTLAKSTQQIPWGPILSLDLRDGKYLNQLVEKNAWFSQFRQSSLYQGAFLKLAPVLFSQSDEFGAQANTWKGRLIEYVYSKLIEGRRVQFYYFNRPKLSSPYVFSMKNLGKTESATIETLVKGLRSTEDQVVDLTEGEDAIQAKITPLSVKQQKFALKFEGGCLSVGRSPEAVAVSNLYCRESADLKADARVTMDVGTFMPALNGVREKFIGVAKKAEGDFKWNSAQSRFVPTVARLAVKKGAHVVLADKIPSEMLKAIPSNVLFFAMGVLPRVKEGYTIESVEKYLGSSPKILRKEKPMAVALAYIPMSTGSTTAAVPSEKKLKEKKAAAKNPDSEDTVKKVDEYHSMTVLLIHQPKLDSKTTKQLATLFNQKEDREVFVRGLCGTVVAISHERTAIDRVQQVCDRKYPSYEQYDGTSSKRLTDNLVSSAVYVGIGAWMKEQVVVGWNKKYKNRPVPQEVESAIRLLGELPHFFYSGKADESVVNMTAQE